GLLGLATDHLRALAQTLNAEDLTWLGAYLAELSQEPANQVVTALLADPALVQVLRDGPGQRLLVEAAATGAPLAFVTRPADGFGVLGDLRSVFSGQVSPRLLLAKYGAGSGVAGLVVVLLLVAMAASLVKRLWNFVVDPFRSRYPAPGR